MFNNRMKRTMASIFGFVLSVTLLFGEETYSSVDTGSAGKRGETFPAGLLKFEDSDLSQVLDVYQDLSGRTVVRSTAMPMAKINIRSQTPLTRIEALQTLDSVLAQNGIVMIPQGTKHVKAVPKQAAPHECPPLVTLPREQLPDSSTYITYMVEVKHILPRDVAQSLQPFASMPNSILGIDGANLIVLRDHSSNVRRMLEILERVDTKSAADKAEARKKTIKTEKSAKE